jgi:hypothetical protein
MSYVKWLITTLSLILIFAVLVVVVNFSVDHHGVRLSLFSKKKEVNQTIYPNGLNQHMFNAELIFRNPVKFDSFLFGSSRTGVIDVSKITSGRFYNMSYSAGLPAEHLAIINAFLQRGVKVKSVAIGLDDFCFNLSATEHQKQLLRIMHPDVNGPNRAAIFAMYFFRKPSLFELRAWWDRVIRGKIKGRFIMNSQGLNTVWLENEKILEATGKPIFQYDTKKYKPITYGRQEMDEAFAAIEKLIELSRKHHFSITFFITPFYSNLYLNNAEALMNVKERLAQLTDYFDFSGFNSVTTNDMDYYEESHYRYRVGDMIIKRIFGDGAVDVPDDFGVLVTRENVGRYIKQQKRELEQYLQAKNLQ